VLDNPLGAAQTADLAHLSSIVVVLAGLAISFQVIGDSTKVHLVQGPFKTEARRALRRHGWRESFGTDLAGS
jgi:hypothetical protein